MRSVSLFSGAMGLDIGLGRAGFETVLAVEKDADCRATIAANRPNLPLSTDAMSLQPGDLPECDIIQGGPPCQPFSTAGAGRGSRDRRFDPFACMLDLIGGVRPRFVLIENVRGFLAPKHSATKEWVFGRLEAFGYSVTAGLYDAADFGVPQHRSRVLIVGSLSGTVPLMRPTHGGEGLPPWLTLADALRGIEPGAHAEFRPALVKYLRLVPPGKSWRSLPPDAQRDAMGAAYDSKAGGRSSYYRRLSWERPCPTVLTSPVQKATPLCHPDHDRPLSVAEYAAVQQFPQDWVFKGSLPSQYRQIGNAVPVGLGEAIGKHIMAHAH